jgi:TonB family protein
MSEAVTDIIVSRSRQSDGLMSMVLWSVAVHAAVGGAVLVMPERQVDEAPRTVMTISLGGAPGPKTDGITQIGGRAVQAKAETPVPIEAPPAPERPQMTLPDPRSRPRADRPRPEQAPKESNARVLSTGDEPRQGSTRSETQVRGQGFGLASAGGSGGPIRVDAENFCCIEYLEQLRDVIQRNWSQQQSLVGITLMKFTIQRNGQLVDIQVERPSGFIALDLASRRALEITRQVGPLPAQYLNPTLTVHMTFEYQR